MEYIVYALIGIIFIQELLHRAERRDLYSRIMCKDITEYKRLADKPADTVVSAHQRALDKWRSKGADNNERNQANN